MCARGQAHPNHLHAQCVFALSRKVARIPPIGLSQSGLPSKWGPLSHEVANSRRRRQPFSRGAQVRTGSWKPKCSCASLGKTGMRSSLGPKAPFHLASLQKTTRKGFPEKQHPQMPQRRSASGSFLKPLLVPTNCKR